MIKQGFTLIELLIVILIIGILAGAVLPYVQQYVEDSRISRAKQDLDEIRNALIRFETDQSRPYTDVDISRLVGPYMNKAIPDPWGSPYVIDPPKSKCYSIGPDRADNTGDEVLAYFRPPLAISRAFWEDTNNTLVVDTGDRLILRFTRPVTTAPITNIAPADFVFSNNPPDNFINHSLLSYGMTLTMEMDFGVNPAFTPGNDTIAANNPNAIVDGDAIQCVSGQATAIKGR